MKTEKQSWARIVFLSYMVLQISSCESFNPPITPVGNLEIDDEVEVAEQIISSAGGTVVVDMPGNQIDGMTILVPPGSYNDRRTFRITTAKITGHKLGEHFHPISPLIQIENSGGYADSIMEITIPISTTVGEIPLGFFYNEIDGTLEGIPVKQATKNTITLLTRHFAPVSELSSDKVGIKSKNIEGDASANLVICSISESILKQKAIISSGFKVGTDNWEFVNYGSFISPGGHCAGQNFAALWYYFEKKLKGDEQLYNRFSTVSSLWQDNAIGYRFCSVVQKDLQWDGRVKSFCKKYIDTNQELDQLKLFIIVGTMLITGEPQAVGIYRQTGRTYSDGTPIYGGHALICTQVAINEGKLYISDPNKPNDQQYIEFKNNKFEPYNAKENGHASSFFYPFITYNAKSALIEWDQIGKRYKEMLDSTIGVNPPNNFPSCNIWVKGKTDQLLKDGFTTDMDTFRCVVECPEAELFKNINGKKLITFDLFNGEGKQIDNWEKEKMSAYVILKPGINRIGFYLYSQRESGSYLDNNVKKYYPLYIDFKWFDVYFSKLKIDPNPIVCQPGKEVKIYALTDGTAPASAKYIWDFGDGSPKITVNNDSTVLHTFSKTGEYKVLVELYNKSTNVLIDTASALAVVNKSILSYLQTCVNIEISLDANFITDNPESSKLKYHGLGISVIPNVHHTSLTWNGVNFSAQLDSISFDTDGGKRTRKTIVSGKVSDDGLKIISLLASCLDAYYLKDNPLLGTVNDSEYTEISISNLPYNSTISDGWVEKGEITYYEEGPVVSQFVSTVKWETSVYHEILGSINSYHEKLSSVDYDNVARKAKLRVFFQD